MQTSSKKGVVIFFSLIILLFSTLVILPFVFRDKILSLAKTELNKQLNADVDFVDLNISLLKHFPRATISLDEVTVVGRDTFATDTLLQMETASVLVDIKSLFGDNGYNIERIIIDKVNVYAHVMPDGRTNWDILPKDSTIENADTVENSAFRLQLRKFEIRESNVQYLDEQSKMSATLGNINFELSGDFTQDSTALETDLTIDKVNYASENVVLVKDLRFAFQADINANLAAQRYHIAQNQMDINAISLSMNGWVQQHQDDIEVDMKLNTDKVDFKSILSLIPAIYANSFADLKASGKVAMSGYAKGHYSQDAFPAFDVTMKVENGKLKYASLPRSVDDIQMVANISHLAGELDNTIVDIPQLSLVLGQDPFTAVLHITTPISDPNLTLQSKGKVNLGLIKDVYPLEEGESLDGILAVDVNLSGRMSYLENDRYDKFKFNGDLYAQNVKMHTALLTQEVLVNSAKLKFSDRYLYLTDFKTKIGVNDLEASGRLENYMGYFLKNTTLKGVFKMNANHLNISDFMSSSATEEKAIESRADTTQSTIILIPKNINAQVNATAKTLLYEKMKFDNAKATLRVANGNVDITNMQVNAFGGKMKMSGAYKTENPTKPKVDFRINLDNVLFAQLFSQVDMVKQIAPIFDDATGKFDAGLTLNTLLTPEMIPDWETLLGAGHLETKAVSLKGVTTLTALAKALNKTDLATTTMRNIALKFNIEDGKLKTNPFDVKIGTAKLQLGGTTGLDKTIDYNGKITLPDALNWGRFQKIAFNIDGTFSQPKVKLDIVETIGNIVKETTDKVTEKVEEVKSNAIEEGRKQRTKLVAEAKKSAEKLLHQAETAGDKLVEEARKQGQKLVDEADNPITKKMAQVGADKLVDAAEKQKTNLLEQAKIEGDKLIQKAEKSTEF